MFNGLAIKLWMLDLCQTTLLGTGQIGGLSVGCMVEQVCHREFSWCQSLAQNFFHNGPHLRNEQWNEFEMSKSAKVRTERWEVLKVPRTYSISVHVKGLDLPFTLACRGFTISVNNGIQRQVYLTATKYSLICLLVPRVRIMRMASNDQGCCTNYI